MFKDKIFHVRRDGGGWEAGLGRLRRPGDFWGVQRAKPSAGVRGVPEIFFFSFCRRRRQIKKDGKRADTLCGEKGSIREGIDACVALLEVLHSKTRVT